MYNLSNSRACWKVTHATDTSVVSDVLGLSIIFGARVERILDLFRTCKKRMKACVGRACSVCQCVSDAPLNFEKRTNFFWQNETCVGRTCYVFRTCVERAFNVSLTCKRCLMWTSYSWLGFDPCFDTVFESYVKHI